MLEVYQFLVIVSLGLLMASFFLKNAFVYAAGLLVAVGVIIVTADVNYWLRLGFVMIFLYNLVGLIYKIYGVFRG
jgi:hypothetical protein